MKTFDFAQALKQGRNSQVVNWFKQFHDVRMSEDEFVEKMQVLKVHRLGSSKKYSPSHLRREYRGLQKNFNFFK